MGGQHGPWVARVCVAVALCCLVGSGLLLWTSCGATVCPAHVLLDLELNKQLTALVKADLVNAATPDDALEIERLRRRVAQLGEIRAGPTRDSLVVPSKVLDDLIARAKDCVPPDRSAIRAMEEEIADLLQQIGKRDRQLEKLARGPALAGTAVPRATREALAEWAAQVEPGSALQESGFFSAANWALLRSVLVLVVTGKSNHQQRAKLQMRTWMTLMPEPHSTILFVTDEMGAELAPMRAMDVPLTEDEAKKDRPYRAAQRRFVHALTQVAGKTFGGEVAPKWVLLLDDDSFMSPANLALLLPKLDARKPHTYAEVCAAHAKIPFACGGGGVLMSLQTLRRSRRALESCHLQWGGMMGQYDVAVSHCFQAAGVSLVPRGEFSAHPPWTYVDEFGKGRAMKSQFAHPVTFHYVLPQMQDMFQQVLDMQPLWPAKNATSPAATATTASQ